MAGLRITGRRLEPSDPPLRLTFMSRTRLRNTQQEIRVAEARIRGVEIVTSIHAVRIVIPAELISYRVKSDFHRMPAARPAHIVSPFEVRIRGQSLRVRLIGSGDACDVKGGDIMDTGGSHALNADLFQDVGADQVGVVIVAPGASCPYVFH